MNREIKIRIDNIGLIKATFIGKLKEEEFPNYEIVKYQRRFGENENCFVIAHFVPDPEDHFYVINFCQDRPLDLTDEEKNIFWEIMSIGSRILNKK